MRTECKDIWINSEKLGALPPEVDDKGNIEYKLKLVSPSMERLEHLITQLKWRLSEGNGVAMYEIGVNDDGTFAGLSTEDMDHSMKTLHQMADALGADVSVVREVLLNEVDSPGSGRRITEALVRLRPTDERQKFSDIRIAIVGGMGAGKSTLLGHITHGAKDNGRGSARLNLLRHRHEIESGKTSSIAHEIIGYDTEGNLINYATPHTSTWEQICASSSKIIAFLDTCGHAKYLRTTISGLTGYAPDYACLVVPANAGRIPEMTREHLSLAVMLDIPVLVVITKTDLAFADQLPRTLKALLSLVRSPWVNRKPVVIGTSDDLVACAPRFRRRGPEIPIFLVSNVTGGNIHNLVKFFSLLPKPSKYHNSNRLEGSIEFQVEKIYSPSDTGIVLGGMLRQGVISTKDVGRTYSLGPNTEGKFVKVSIASIHQHRMPTHRIHGGQTATIAIHANELEDWRVKRGMVLLDTEAPESFMEFEAEIIVLHHPKGLTVGGCGTIHSGSIRQRARVISIKPQLQRTELSAENDDLLTPSTPPTDLPAPIQLSHMIPSGHRGFCTLRFMHEPEYLAEDAQILFMEGKSKCLGRVTRLVCKSFTNL